MPTPTLNDMHISSVLTGYTVGALQDETEFVLSRMAPIVEVEKKTDKYHIYPIGGFNRLEMRTRQGPQESAGSGWELSDDNYDCALYSVHKDITEDEAANADMDIKKDATFWGANQIRITGDALLASVAFGSSIWTTDITGVAAAPVVGTSVLQWNDSSSDPQEDIQLLINLVKSRCGMKPNKIVIGETAHSYVLTNTVVRDAIKYTNPTVVSNVLGQLANFFGVQEYIVAGGVYNTAAEGQTKSMSNILDAKGLFLGYVNPNQTPHSMSALKTFAWKRGGVAKNGVAVKSFPMPHLNNATRYEFDLNIDVKVVSADAGCYITGVVA